MFYDEKDPHEPSAEPTTEPAPVPDEDGEDGA